MATDMDCEQLLQQIASDTAEIKEALEVFGDALVSNKDDVAEMKTQLNQALNNMHSVNVDTNNVSKAILKYLNKVQNFLKI